MKHCSIGVILFILVLIICLALTYVVYVRLADTEDLLQQAISFQRNGDFTNSTHYLLEAQQSWENSRRFYCSVLNHDELDRITEQFYTLQFYAEQKQFDELLGSSIELMHQLAELQEICIPYYFNILSAEINVPYEHPKIIK